MGRGSSKAGRSGGGAIDNAKWSKFSPTQTGRKTTLNAGGAKATISTSIDSSGEFFRLDLSKNGKTKTYGHTDLPSGVHSMDTVRAFAKRELKRM